MQNSIYAIIAVTPSLFSPDNDGIDDITSIQYQLAEPGYMGSISIFDMAGRPVKYLARNVLLGISGSWNWDGLSETGAGRIIQRERPCGADQKTDRTRRKMTVDHSVQKKQRIRNVESLLQLNLKTHQVFEQLNPRINFRFGYFFQTGRTEFFNTETGHG